MSGTRALVTGAQVPGLKLASVRIFQELPLFKAGKVEDGRVTSHLSYHIFNTSLLSNSHLPIQPLAEGQP